MKRRVFLSVLSLISALGAYLRFVDLSEPSLWLDEILHLQIVRSLGEQPWTALLTGMRASEVAPENGPLYYGLQMLGQWLFPGDPGVRVFPALIGTLTLPLMALVGHRLGGVRVSLVATFMLAVSPLHVYFSREGRPYYLLMVLALVLLWSLLEDRSRVAIATAYGGCLFGVLAGIHSGPILVSFLGLSVVQLLLTFRARRSTDSKQRLIFVHLTLAALLALLMSYGMYMSHSTINTPTTDLRPEQMEFQESPGFESPLSGRSRERFLASMTTSGHPAVLMVKRSWLLLAIAVLGVCCYVRRLPREALVTCAMFVLPAASSIAALVTVGRWYGVRYTSSALPAFVLLTAFGVVAAADLGARAAHRFAPRVRGRLVSGSLVAVLLLLLIAPNVVAARAHPQRKLDWRGIAEFVDHMVLEGEPILVPNYWPEVCLDYYLKQRGRDVEFVSIWETVALGEEEVAKRDKGWMLTAGYRKSNEARAWMHGFVPVLKRRQEEMALFFFPDLVTLLETRSEADNDGFFVEQFDRMQRRFDFGGGELALQGKGWSYPEDGGSGMKFQWTTGAQAELGVPIADAQDALIRLRVQPFSYPGSPDQQLELVLNDSVIAKLQLQPGWSEHEVAVGLDQWSGGANVLYLRSAHSARPIRVLEGSTDRRPLAVAFDFLEVVL